MIRKFLIALATAGVVLLALVGVAFNSGFQTWAVRRVFAARPALQGSIGKVAVGVSRVELRSLRIERRGAVLTLPHLEAELPLFSGLKHRLLIRRLVATGWTLDLTRFDGGRHESAVASAKAGPFHLVSSASADVLPAPLPPEVFQGLLDQLTLPMDFALDGLELEGDVILPPVHGRPGGRARAVISGGGLAAGSEGRFIFTVKFTPPAGAAPVNSVAVDGTLTAAMDSGRTFARFAIQMDAAASGVKIPGGVRISAAAAAVRDPDGENYSLTLAGQSRQLAALQAAFPKDRRRLAGTWTLDLGDDDVAPFALGRRLPVFNLVGGGRFETDAAFAELHASGRLNAMADNLALIRPELSGVGAVKLTADFDLTRRGSTLRIDRLTGTLAGDRPILTVHGLQAFAFNAGTGELTVADASRDLLGVSLQGVPLRWVQPWISGVVLTEGSLEGGLVASAREGGLSLRSTSPLTIASLSATRSGQPLFQGLGASLDASAAYTPQGWQAEISGQVLTADIRAGSQDRVPLLNIEAKCGRLAGMNRPIKIAGRLGVGLPAALRVFYPSGAEAALTSGNFTCDFAASLDGRREVGAKLGLSDLAIEEDDGHSIPVIRSLPGVTADVRADFGSDGQIAFNAPFRVERDGRASDLTVAGAFARTPAGLVLKGQVASAQLYLEDAKGLGALLRAAVGGFGIRRSPAEGDEGGGGGEPFWGGLDGQLSLSLKSVVSPQFTATNAAGTLHFDPGMLSFDGLGASVAGYGDVSATGRLAFDGNAAKPYAFNADVTVGNFDPAPIFRALNPGRMPPVEGKFAIAGRLSGDGDLAGMPGRMRGDLHLTSKGGILRMLSTEISPKGSSESKMAAISSFLGDMAATVTGRKDASQSIAELARKISTIPYDQMSVEVVRDASLNTVLRDFILISPEMRLEGEGRVSHQEGTPLLKQPLTLELKLRARGKSADLLKFAGVLDSRPDDLGYYVCTLPLKIGGTLAKPDTSELQMTLLNAAYEHSGAADLINKLLGK